MDVVAPSQDTVVVAAAAATPRPVPPVKRKRHRSSTTTRSPVKRRNRSEPVALAESPMSTLASDESVPLVLRSSSSRPNLTASSSITLDMLRPHFEEPLATVAARFGICVTLLKKICRRQGIARWPHRQITGLRKSIASMEHAIGYFDGARRASYAEQLVKQKHKLAALLEDPMASTLPRVETTTTADLCDPHAKKPTHVLLVPGTDTCADDVAPPAVLTRASSPTGPLFFESPYNGAASGTLPLQTSPTWLSPNDSSYTLQYQDLLCLSSTLKQSHRAVYPTTNYCPFGGNTPGATAPICLPPLRPEPRGVLPPISSLVVSSSSKTHASVLPTVIW